MTDASLAGQKAPLGVGGIISDSFSILFGNFGKVFVLGFLGAFLGFIVNALFLGAGAAMGTGEIAGDDGTAIIVGSLLSTLVNMIVYGIVTALLIQLAYDAKLGRSNGFGTYIGAALPAILPIVVLTIVIMILASIGMIALIIGGLWVYAVFYVMAPVAVIEKGGFGSMGRSAALTKEYRWPIVGLFIVITIISMILQFVGAFVVGFVAGIGVGTGSVIIGGVLLALISGLAYALAGIAIALTYARLREIKEGVDVDQIAAVFE